MNEKIEQLVELLFEKSKPGLVYRRPDRHELELIFYPDQYPTALSVEVKLNQSEVAEGLVMAQVKVDGVKYRYPFKTDMYAKAEKVADMYFLEQKHLEEKKFEENASVINKLIGALKDE